MRILAALSAIGAVGLALATAERSGKLPCCTDEVTKSAGAASAPLACLLTSKQMRERKDELMSVFDEATLAVNETDDGYTVSLAKGHAASIAEFIELERACCPFFEFNLAFAPEDGPITLSVTGPEGSKKFSSQLFEPLMKQKQ